MKKIFISYAHRDEEWKDRLVKQLNVLALEGFCDVWEDRQIRVGDDWKPGIETALKEADIAILMVSADFLVSNFIRTEEVPRILERRKTEGLWVIPVFVKPCPWQKVAWLQKIQGEPRDGKTLEERDGGGQAERILADLAEKIAERIQADDRTGVSPSPGRQVSQPGSGHLENPFTDTMAIRDGVRFIGRESELRRLKQMLRGGSVSLQGDHKMGKSSLLWKLADIWEGTVFGPLSFQEKHWDEMVEEITFKSGKIYKDRRDFRDALLNSRALLLLDEMELGQKKGLTHKDCSLLRGCLEENRTLKIVMASHKAVMQDAHFVGVDSPLYNIFLPFLLGPFEEADARRLLAHPWAAGVPVFEAEVEEELLSLAVYSSQENRGYHPYLLQRAAYDRFESGGSFCSDPEWPLIQNIDQQRKKISSLKRGVIGEEVLLKPVLNPYVGHSGLPVIGSSFIGRADFMRDINKYWTSSGLMPVLILYGHRRMGKTSVLRNLAQNTDPNNLYVYLDMQNVGWVEHTSQLLLGFAEAVHKAVSKSGINAGRAPDHGNYNGLGTARRSLNALLDSIDEQMPQSKRLLLAIDEFELIEQGILEKRIDPGFLPYLCSINQQYPWLGLIFAGLHTLDEMGRDYHNAFFGQAQFLRLGYLSPKDALKLITQPHPDFALEYEDALIDEIQRLTFGQPYLVQLLCWELVNGWNERFLENGETTPRILKTADLAPVLTPDFYQGAGYYFEGVWGNATENEQHLMRIIAKYENKPLPRAQLEAEAKKSAFPTDREIMDETLELLSRHDIITENEKNFRFASELMRRWIANQK